MARIRSIHPGQWTDSAFLRLSAYAKLMALGLRNEADDRGIFEWDPIMLKVRLLPADKFDEDAVMQELTAADVIRAYEMGGRKLGAIRNFLEFNSPRFPTHTYPINKELLNYVGIERRKIRNSVRSNKTDYGETTEMDGVEHTSLHDGEGIGVGKGIGEGEKKKEVGVAANAASKPPKEKTRGSRLPPDWIPQEADVEKLIEQGMGQQVFERELAKFMDYWKARAGAGGVKLDWDATYRNWMAKVREDGKFDGA